MRRLACILRTAVVGLVAVAASGVGTATAATGPATGATAQAVLVAQHGLGAAPPSTRIGSPRAGNAAARVAATALLPTSVDLRRWALTPGYQGPLNSCVPWVIDYALLGWYSNFAGRTGPPFAPMYTYSQINGGGDYGSDPQVALDIAQAQGTDTVAHYIKGDNWRHVPTASERANAAKYKITGYDILFSGANESGVTTALRTALAGHRPVAIKLAVRTGFDNLGSSPTAVDNDVASGIRGYHEVLAVGYDAAGLIVQNSWGTGWANRGFGRIAWRVVQKDVWEGETIRGLIPATPPTVRVAIARHSGPRLTPTTTPMTITWSGTAGTSGPIVRYEAWYQVDANSRVALRLPSARPSAVRITARIGHRYRIWVRARSATTVGAITSGSWFVA